jgi:WD40 repeat protein
MYGAYSDLTVTIGSSTPEGYPVTLRGPGGDARGLFVHPAADPLYVGLAERLARLEAGEAEIAALGAVLFRTLFHGALKEGYARALAALPPAHGLRVRLDIDPREAEVAALPWEYLRDPDGAPLALHASPLMRYLPQPTAVPALKAELPLRVLLTAAATPPPAAVDRELAGVRRALERLGSMVEVQLEARLTAAVLQDRLRQGFHVWHFVGHGATLPDGSGALMLDDGTGDAAPLAAPALAALLGGSGVRLALLNACEGAALAADPLRALAPALIAAGIPAVVAMQFAVAEESARAFAAEFYQALAEGFPIDACVTEGRRAVLAFSGSAHPDWGVPALYSRAPDGMLFDLPALPKPACPYPGMVPFAAEDARHFHGREAEIERMLHLLRVQNRLLVIGPSGSGKSSLIRAGLLPRLRDTTLFPANTWLVREFRPGQQPATRLAQALGADPASHAETALDRAPQLIDDLLAANPPATRLLLLIDQFEELFTVAERDEQLRFVSGFQKLRHEERCTLLIAMRADFYPDLMNSALWPIDPAQRLEVAPLRGEALRAAIERPAGAVGVRVESGLVDRILADAAGEPGALPLVQEALVLLWDRMPHRMLPLRAYDELGGDGRNGLAVAIATRADATMASLDDAQRHVARRVLLRLVQFGEGRADTRRQQPLEALRVPGEDQALFDQTLRRLVDDRLLTAGTVENAGVVVDISHEALIRGWPALQEWIATRREAEQTRRRLEDKAGDWLRLGGGQGGLLDDIELAEAERWLVSADAADLGVSDALTALVAASRSAITNAAAQQRRARRLQTATLAAVGLLVIAVLAAGLLFAQREAASASQRAARDAEAAATAEASAAEQARLAEAAQAERTRAEVALRQAQARELAALSQSVRSSSPQLSALLAVEAISVTLSAGEPPVPAAEEGLHNALVALGGRPLDLELGAVTRSAVSGDRRWLVTAYENGSLLLRDLAADDPFQPEELLNHGLPVQLLALDHAGRTLVAYNSGGELLLWRLASGTVSQVPQVLRTRPDASYGAFAVSPTGGHLMGMTQQGFDLWDLDASADAQPLRIAAPSLYYPRFSPDGRLIASVTLEGVVLFDVTDPDPVATARDLSGTSSDVAFSPDSRLLAIGELLWDLTTTPPTSRMVFPPTRLNTTFLSLTFSADGSWLVSTGENPRAVRVDAAEPQSVVRLPPTTWLVAAPVGTRFALVEQETITIWDASIEDANAFRSLTGHTNPVTDLVFSSDGEQLTSSSSDRTVRVWHLEDADPPPGVEVLHGPDSAIVQSALGAMGTHVLALDEARTLRGWELASAGPSPVLDLARWDDAVLSADGRRLAVFTNPRISIYDLTAADPAMTEQVITETTGIQQLGLNADGSMLVAIINRGAQRWDLRHDPPLQREIVIDEQIYTLSQDGSMVFTLDATGNLGVWDLRSDAPTKRRLPVDEETKPQTNLSSAQFSPDGRWGIIVYGFLNEQIALWDLRLDPPVVHLPPSVVKSWSVVAVSPDGRHLALGGQDGIVRVYRIVDGNARESFSLNHYSTGVEYLSFSADGGTLLAVTRDQGAWLWDVASFDDIPQSIALRDAGPFPAVPTRDGTAVVGFDTDGRVRRWSLRTDTLIAEACRLAGRNLSADEWRQQFPKLPYRPTCPALPEHPSVLEEALSEGFQLARSGDIGAALAKYREVERRGLPSSVSVEDWNRLCRAGIFAGRVKEVLEVCGRVLALAPDHGPYRDSRALVRALTGDTAGAADDFAVYLDWARRHHPETLAERIARREAWLTPLRRGEQPIDATALARVRAEDEEQAP